MEFHERLRYLIDCEEMKIKDLAAKLHLAPSTLGNYVQGTREPDYDTLRRIADYFGVSIDYLLGILPGKCEKVCPQHLHIRDLLADVAAEFEKKG